MGRLSFYNKCAKILAIRFPMIPPQVNGATRAGVQSVELWVLARVSNDSAPSEWGDYIIFLLRLAAKVGVSNDSAPSEWGDLATYNFMDWGDGAEFPMIPPQVNGATRSAVRRPYQVRLFPMIPPQVNGATP